MTHALPKLAPLMWATIPIQFHSLAILLTMTCARNFLVPDAKTCAATKIALMRVADHIEACAACCSSYAQCFASTA